MELVVKKNDLLRELQLFQGIVERKNTIPILANVLMEARGNEIRMLATDLEVALRSRCDAAVEKGGTLTLPAKKLFEIVKALPETDVRIAEDKNGVKVAADRFDSRMQTLPKEDFPAVPEASGATSATLPRAALKEMVAKTQFAITGEDTRFFLNGALFILGGSEMSLVATDGHRLALVKVDRKGGKPSKEGEEIRAILPRKTLWELGKLLTDGDGDIRYERGENHLFFDIGGRMLISRMIDGQFPAFERVIPKGNNKRIEFERERLTNAVRRVALALERAVALGEVSARQRQGRSDVEQPGVRRSQRNAAGRLFRRQHADLFQRAVRDGVSRRGGNRSGRARAEGRSQPGGDEADRNRRIRLHVRDYAHEGMTASQCSDTNVNKH